MSKFNQLFLFLLFLIFAFLTMDWVSYSFVLGFSIVPIMHMVSQAWINGNEKKERIKKYRKYLRAAGLPEDIKDVLGHFLYFEISFDGLIGRSHPILGFSFSNHELKLILHEREGSEDLFVNIKSDDNAGEKFLVELKIDKGLPAVSNFVPNSIKII